MIPDLRINSGRRFGLYERVLCELRKRKKKQKVQKQKRKRKDTNVEKKKIEKKIRYYRTDGLTCFLKARRNTHTRDCRRDVDATKNTVGRNCKIPYGQSRDIGIDSAFDRQIVRRVCVRVCV